MATIVSTLTPTADLQSANGSNGGAFMTPAMRDIEIIKSSVPELLDDDVLLRDLNGSRRPRSDIRKGIPSLPQIWNKRLSAREERRQAKRNSSTSLAPQLRTKEPAAVYTPPAQQVPHLLLEPERSAEKQKVKKPLAKQALPESTELNAEGFEISMPLQLRERLKTWNLSSALQLTADENTIFESSEIERLKQFSHFLYQNGSALFHGLPSRNLVLTPVAVTGPSASWKCICIKGLTKESEITSFHAVLSQRSVRAHYKPWKLCYDKSLVETAASVATYQTNTPEAPQTLCGTLLRTKEPGKGTWISTIGGIIEVDGEFFAVTSAHHPSHSDPASDESMLDSAPGSPGTSMTNTLVEEGAIDMDVEPALIIDTWKEQEPGAGSPNAVGTATVLLAKPPQPTDPFFWPDLTTTVQEGFDWRLLTIGEEHKLPNCIPFQRSTEGAQSPATVPSPVYLIANPVGLSKRAVYILAGVSGVCPGTLSNNVSFFNLRNDEPQIVWSVKLDRGFGLQKGDSGSWVIDALTNNILGYVVAISAGSLYLIPLTELFKQILRDRHPDTTVCVPSAFKVLLKLARYHYAVEPSGTKILSDYYSSEALSPQVLKSTSSDQILLLLRSAIARGEDRSLLARLICTLEVDLWPLLGYFSRWSSEQKRMIDQDLVPILNRMENSPLRSNPDPRTYIELRPSSMMVDAEKKSKPQENPDLKHTIMLANTAWLTWGRPSKGQMVLLGIALFFTLAYLSVLVFSVAGGVVATVTFAHMEGLPYSRELLGDGAIGALVLTAIFHVQYAVALFFSYKRLSPNWRRYCGLSYSATLFGFPLLPLQFGLSFARTLLTALILMSKFHTRNSRPIFIGATVAAIPLVNDAIVTFRSKFGYSLILMPGLNALAGFIFSIISQRYGYDFSRYSSATAAAAVYGAVNLWSASVLHSAFYSFFSRLEDETLAAELMGIPPPGITDFLSSSRWSFRNRPPFVFHQSRIDDMRNL